LVKLGITLIRRGLWLFAAALWAEEFREALTSWRGIDPRTDLMLDSTMVTLTIVLAGWSLSERYLKHQKGANERIDEIFTRMNQACEAAGVQGTGDSGPHRRLRPVEDGKAG
jgi:hypothetical protein